MIRIVWIILLGLGSHSQVYATKLMRISYHDDENAQYKSAVDRFFSFPTAFSQFRDDDSSHDDSPLPDIPDVQIYPSSEPEQQFQISDVQLKFRSEADFNPERHYRKVQSRTKPTYSNSKPRTEYSTAYHQPSHQKPTPSYFKPATNANYDKTTSYQLSLTLPSYSQPAPVSSYSRPAPVPTYPKPSSTPTYSTPSYTKPQTQAPNYYPKQNSHSNTNYGQSTAYGHRSHPKTNSYSASSYQRPQQRHRGNSKPNSYSKPHYQQSNSHQHRSYQKANVHQQQTYTKLKTYDEQQQTYTKPRTYEQQNYQKPNSYQTQNHAKPTSHQRPSYPKPTQQYRPHPKPTPYPEANYQQQPVPDYTNSDPHQGPQSTRPSAYVYEFRSEVNDFNKQEEDYNDDFGVSNIPGEAGINYPTMSHIPFTSFSCNGLSAGFYADTETNCQVWHYCDLENRKESFLCSNGTIYNQASRVCEWWYNVDCSLSTQFYNINDDLYKVPAKNYGYSRYQESSHPKNYYDYE